MISKLVAVTSAVSLSCLLLILSTIDKGLWRLQVSGEGQKQRCRCRNSVECRNIPGVLAKEQKVKDRVGEGTVVK